MLPGHAALIDALKVDGKTTGPEAAAKVLAAEREKRAVVAASEGRKLEQINLATGAREAAIAQAAANGLDSLTMRDLAHAVGKSTTVIVTAVEQQGFATQEISHNITETASGAKDVVRAMTEVSGRVGETLRCATDVLDAIDAEYTVDATAITITHDMSSVRAIADRVALLDRGRVRWQGDLAAMETAPDDYLHDFIAGRARPMARGPAPDPTLGSD